MNSNLYSMRRSTRMRDFHNAVDALREIPNEQAIPILEELRNDSNPELRCRGLTGLVKVSPNRAEGVGLEMLSDAHAGVRWWAVYWLSILNARNRSRTAVPAIANLLRTDPDELVRSEAASALGDIGGIPELPDLEFVVANDHGTDHEGVPNSKTANKAIQKIMQRAGA